MSNIRKADRFFSGVEWKLSLANMAWGLSAAVASFALPAWAVKASKVFEQYAPLSWVVAGFIGLFAGVIIYSLAAWGKAKWVRSRYDAKMLASGGSIDPLEKTFERKRIYLNEFCLASHPFVEDKTFIDCEIIGPSNIILVQGNKISDPRYPICDAVLMASSALPSNGYIFTDCNFRRCNFTRVTFLVPYSEYYMFNDFNYIKWITTHPNYQEELQLGAKAEDQQLLSLQGTVEETQQ